MKAAISMGTCVDSGPRSRAKKLGLAQAEANFWETEKLAGLWLALQN